MENNNQPLVSVILPVRNGQKFIAEAIDSILNQTYQNLELIIINDGSTDKTKDILLSYSASNIKVINLAANRGESAAANIGFHHAKGEFIARMDADDISHPQRIEKQVDLMLSDPSIVVVGTQALVINEQGYIIGKKTFPVSNKKIYDLYGICNPMLHPSCIFRRSLLPQKHKLWENNHEPNDDYITLFRLLNCGKFINLDEALVFYRIHGKNKSLENPKSKVFNFLSIRWYAVTKYHYKLSLLMVIGNFIQILGVILLPESLIVPTYMLLRGIYSPVSRGIFRTAAEVKQSTLLTQ